MVLENLALRQQLAIYKRKQNRPRLMPRDRWFWMVLARLWKGWRGTVFIVHPDTVARWQRKRFRAYWTRLSNSRRTPGRPRTSREIRELIRVLGKANPLWRGPRIHGELRKLGIKVSERTVSRVLATIKRPPSQTWRTFLKNHIGATVATDFFTVPTAGMGVLFVFLVLAHERRKVLHFGITEPPTSEWVGQQVVEAFVDGDAARYLIHDRDGSYGNEFRRRVQSLGTREILTAPRSPWQNAFIERLIDSIRRECLEHIVVLNQRHLKQDTEELPGLLSPLTDASSFGKGCSRTAAGQEGRIIAVPQVGGLHHRYERRAA